MFTRRERTDTVNMSQHDALLNECLVKLRGHLGRQASLAKVRRRDEAEGPDAVYRLTPTGGSPIDVCVGIKAALRPALLPSVEAQASWWREQTGCSAVLLVASHVSESLAQKLRRRGIWFVDAAGNAYVEVAQGFLVYVVGRRPARSKPSATHWMTEQGAKVLYELLACGPLVEATYRDIEESTGVSLGLISKLVSAWVKDGSLRRAGQGTYEIVEGARLLEMWLSAFAAKLEPKIVLGRYRPTMRGGFASMIEAARAEMDIEHITLGGEYAAELLVGHLRAGSVRLYVPEEERGRVQRAFQLAPSPQEGSVLLCEAFAGDLGRPSTGLEIKIAHPALIYAELMSSDDARLASIALRLKASRLTWIR
jgi:hypothetical protein